jgi:hypothetical protein
MKQMLRLCLIELLSEINRAFVRGIQRLCLE